MTLDVCRSIGLISIIDENLEWLRVSMIAISNTISIQEIDDLPP